MDRVNNTYFKQPLSPNAKIWRYMSLEKFLISMTKGLYLCRADLLGDKFEGTITEATFKAFISDAERKVDYEQNRKNHYISSWYTGNTESYLMWKHYGSQDGSIAIQSTYKKLQDSIVQENPKTFFVGAVQYVTEMQLMKLYVNAQDGKDRLHLAAPFFYKKKPFMDEKEIRLVKYEPTSYQGVKHPGHNKVLYWDDHISRGHYLEVKFDLLIEKIWISPWALKGTAEMLCDILEKRYGISKLIKTSSLVL